MKTRKYIATFLLMASAMAAQGQTRFQDWFLVDASDNSGDVIAATSTENGNELLGYRCFLATGKCLYALINDATCQDKEQYPLLLNSPTGAALVTGICHTDSGNHQLVLSPYKNIEGAIQRGEGLLGFAIPMKSGQFRAVRFSVRGGRDALRAAELLSSKRRETTYRGRSSSTTF